MFVGVFEYDGLCIFFEDLVCDGCVDFGAGCSGYYDYFF